MWWHFDKIFRYYIEEPMMNEPQPSDWVTPQVARNAYYGN